MRAMAYLDLDNFPHTLPYEKTIEDFQSGSEDIHVLQWKAFGDLEQLSKLPLEKQQTHTLIPCPKLTKKKNSTDMRLSVEIMKDLLTNHSIDTFIIASADSDYIPVIKEVKERGKECILLTQNQDHISEAMTEIADQILVCEKQTNKPVRDRASRAKIQELLGKLFSKTQESQIAVAGLNSYFTSNGYNYKSHGYKSFKQCMTTCLDKKRYEIDFDAGLLFRQN
jgi:uncharacterized LabA/DUF88 family protein